MVNAANATEQGDHYSRPICLLDTLDVKNAFNSVRWDKALDYLLRIIGNYLKDRSIVYDNRWPDKERNNIWGSPCWVLTYRMSPTLGSCAWKCPRARSWLGMRTT